MTKLSIPDSLLDLLSDAERASLSAEATEAPGGFGDLATLLLQRAQQALRRKDLEFAALVETSPDMVVRVDVDLRITYANPAFLELLHSSPDDVVDRQIGELPLPEQFTSKLQAATREVVDSGDEKRMELDLVAEPRNRSFCLRLAPERMGAGNTEGVIVVMHEETEQRFAEQQLQESRDLVDGALQGLSAQIAILSGAGKILAVNEAWKQFARENGLEDEKFGVDTNYLDVADRSARSGDVIGAEIAEAIRRVAAGQRDDISIEYPCHGPDKKRWFVARITRFQGGGNAQVVVAHENVTERKLAEQARQQSEERYHRLFQNSLDGVLLADLGGNIQAANPAACDMLGYTEAEIRAAGLEKLLDGTDPRIIAALEERLSTGGFRGELTFVRKDRTRVPVDLTTTIYSDGSGATQASMIIRDITDQKLAEDRLREAEAHYRRLVTTAPQCIYVLDKGGKFIEINPAGERLLGREAADILGHHFAEVISVAYMDEAGEAYAQVVSGEADNLQIEAVIRRPDDDERVITLSVTAIMQGEEITGVHGIAQDITVERARESQRRLLATALDRLQEGIFILSLEGEYLYSNQTFARIFEISPEVPAPKLFGDLAPDRKTWEMLQTVKRVATEQGRWSGRIRRRDREGRQIPLDTVLGRVDHPSGPESSLLFGIVQDASVQMEREQQLRRIERLASLGTLIGGVAHELNNPLHAIINFSELMLQEERNPDDLEALEIMRREADRAAKVVADLRQIARETQGSNRERVPIDLNEVIDHLLRVRRYSLRTGNVEVREDLASGLPAVLADRSEIEQVVMNLLVNAEQALASIPGQKLLTLRTRPTPEGAAIHVMDNGPGIPPEHLDRIFDPFFTTKAPGEGTGLGLSLVHSIVSEHGGAIQVDSKPGRGTTFQVDLPAAPPDNTPADGVAKIAHQARRRRVLVVDDEEAIRRVTALYLEHLGHEVQTASDGEEALRVLEQLDFDVIVSDLRMPGMGGEDLLTKLRQIGKGLCQRLIFVTGEVGGGPDSTLFGDVPVISKPIQMQELARALERVATDE